LADDFNSPILIAHLFEAVTFIFKLKEGKETLTEKDAQFLTESLNVFLFEVLGLQNIEENNNAKLDQTLQVLIELRNQARKSKNFDLSDQIRDRLLAEGIELKDGRDGTSYVLN
jgi:cysteinyl-tRNA synthetase